MDAKIKKCSSCSEFYHIKALNSKSSSSNIPLCLSCGHSMCETCVRNFVKLLNIKCRVCHQDTHVSPKDFKLFLQNKIPLYNFFPVNIHMVGELALQTIETKNYNQKEIENDCFINIEEVIKTMDSECVECCKPTLMKCEQCDINVCKDCFNKSHKTFVIFQKHALRAIGNKQKNNCNSHPNKQLDYYCNDCSKPICIDCFLVGGEKTCQLHCILSIHDNKNSLTELAEISPKMDEVFRRLTKTAVDIGISLTKLGDESNTTAYSTVMNKIDAHFSKINCIIQQQKADITQQVLKMKIAEIESLKKAKNDVAENLKKARTILNSIEFVLSEPDKLLEIDLSSLLEEAERVVKTPWCLKQLESGQSVDVIIKEDTSITNCIQLKEQNSEYRLCSTEELIVANEEIPQPPTSIVYPPEHVKDKRQKSQHKNKTTKSSFKMPLFFNEIPKFQRKSGFCTSHNSNISDFSHKASQFHDNRPVMELVTPFPETQQPKQFFEGSRELVYITHIVDPHNFYVQRAKQQACVKKFVEEFKNADSYKRPSEGHVTEGKMYLAYCNEDSFWHRCRIVNIYKSDANITIYHVFSIDFGCSYAVKIDNLRYIPPARMFSPPPFAVNCSLADCEPINDFWTSDDNFLIRDIIDDKIAVLHIKHIICMPAEELQLYVCDVTTLEEGISVAHALAFHGRARIPVDIPYPKIVQLFKKPELFIGSHDFKKNSIEEVVITHIVNPDHFSVRELYLQPIYEQLCDDLEQEYNLSNKTDAIYLPEQNMACIANIEKYDLRTKWARAVVLELAGSAYVRVLLADIGAIVRLHSSALRRIHTKYTLQRGYASECHLAGVTPLSNKWDPESVTLLQSFQYRPLEMHVKDNSDRNSLGITLYDKCDEQNVICVNEQMIKNEFAVNLGLFMFNKNTLNKPHLEKQLPKPKPKGQITILKNQLTMSRKPNDENLKAKDKGPLKLEAKILNYQSPSLIYVSLVFQQKGFTKLFQNIQKYYSMNKTQGRTDWKVGDRCCTICKQSQTWRRAIILELKNENAIVFFSDFACVETVPVLSLREITQELASKGDAAIMCHLHGVISATGEEWPSVSKEFLKKLLDAYDRFFITKVGKFKGKSMPIELWVYHTLEGGTMETNTIEWRCLNYKIIEQGLAIPDGQDTEKKKITNNRGDEELSLNTTYEVEPMPLKNLKMANASTPIEIDTSNEESQTSNIVFVSDWLPPESLSNNEFTAMPTYVDDAGVIYLHDITQQDTLEMISMALEFRFSNQRFKQNQPDSKAKFVKWTIGEPCIALFYLDNRFYRGKVLEVNYDTSTCQIHYIDYGNVELCAFENLRKSIALYQIPTQAHKCILSRIRPVNNHWDRQSLDYIHKSVVEKQCCVKVSGPPISGLIPVEITYNNLWINDHLVDLDVAVYTDGPKAIARKFEPIVKEIRN